MEYRSTPSEICWSYAIAIVFGTFISLFPTGNVFCICFHKLFERPLTMWTCSLQDFLATKTASGDPCQRSSPISCLETRFFFLNSWKCSNFALPFMAVTASRKKRSHFMTQPFFGHFLSPGEIKSFYSKKPPLPLKNWFEPVLPCEPLKKNFLSSSWAELKEKIFCRVLLVVAGSTCPAVTMDV